MKGKCKSLKLVCVMFMSVWLDYFMKGVLYEFVGYTLLQFHLYVISFN